MDDPKTKSLFNTILKRLVAWISSSLLLKIQWYEHHYLSEHGCHSVWEFQSCDHKVDPGAGCCSAWESQSCDYYYESGTTRKEEEINGEPILIKESYIKVKDARKKLN